MDTGRASAPARAGNPAGLPWPVVLLAIVATLAALFRGAFGEMLRLWEFPEYSHGYLIPFLAAYLFAIRAGALGEARLSPSWWGLALLAVALVALLVGQLAALFIIQEYAFVLAVWALVLALVGGRGVRIIWASLAMLVFLIPLPFLVQQKLSGGLQFLSTDMAAAVLRAVGVPVFVEGNVIDMGVSKLQVVEACSGLRYLFPLLSFGLICAYVYRGPAWHRWAVFLSTIPITIVMNSIRIAITGILYDNYGIGAGDSFLHFFEGWVIFCGCLAVLFLEMFLLARLQGRSLDEAFDPQLPGLADLRALGSVGSVSPPILAAVPLLLLALGATFAVSGRTEVIPAREPFVGFPLRLGDWVGDEEALSDGELAELKLSDYLLVNFRSPREELVNLYVAYYESQRSGVSVHSPRACLPGGGWQIMESRVIELPGVLPDGRPLRVNQLVIGMGERRQLVNYWFSQRGRNLTNEYAVKWYIFWDSLTQRRTDGALVRLVTPLGDPANDDEARQRLLDFTRLLDARLAYYIPQAAAPGATGPTNPLLPAS
jgi:exosortase D (VPLPA-CTERM-specific)